MTQGQSQVNPSTSSGLTLSQVEESKRLAIKEFAQICRTTPRTLRFYEQKGLFKPFKVDPENKYRLYHPRQARDFLKIRLLQNFHIPLGQIKKKIKRSTAEKYLQEELKRITEEIKEKEREYKFLEKIKYLLSQEKNLRNVFKEKTFGPFKIFCMKVEHGEYAKITDYVKFLWKEAIRRKLNCENSEITFYLKDVYNPKNTPMEIALILKNNNSLSLREPAKQSQEIATVAKGDLAMTNNRFYYKFYPKTKIMAYEYTGPYEYLILVYQKLYSYFEDNKIDLKGFVFEAYKHGPLNTKSKYDYQTMIGFPI